MGKTVDQLKLNDQPLPQIDPRDQPWYKLSTRIGELLNEGSYDWAAQTLEDIQATVERTQCVTPGQQLAVDNIEAAGHRQADRRRSRRYEGHRRW